MSWKKTLLGVGVGIATGVLIQKKLLSNQYISGNDALQQAKDTFKKTTKVIGSWVYMVPEKMERFNISYDVYRAGINTLEGDTQKNFELLLDAKTGSILEITEK